MVLSLQMILFFIRRFKCKFFLNVILLQIIGRWSCWLIFRLSFWSLCVRYILQMCFSSLGLNVLWIWMVVFIIWVFMLLICWGIGVMFFQIWRFGVLDMEIQSIWRFVECFFQWYLVFWCFSGYLLWRFGVYGGVFFGGFQCFSVFVVIFLLCFFYGFVNDKL